MKSRRTLLCVCVLLSLLPAVAQAGITYISQNRFVWVANSWSADSSAPVANFAPMSVDVDVLAAASVMPQPAYWPYYEVYAQHSSTLNSDSIVAKGLAEDNNPYIHYDTIAQSAQSHFEVVFDLTGTNKVLLTGYLEAYWDDFGDGDDGQGLVKLTLSEYGGPDLYTTSWNGAAGFGHVSIDAELTLAAGTYALEIDAATSGDYEGTTGASTVGGGGFAKYDVRVDTIMVPAPAALTLLLPGLGGLAWFRRKRA